ncbi:MAG: SagB/ThcOx family dehydrogenase [Anaerolineaceae bacterium]|nr:SagB/ThcOx family dehydrogenase [Anaerolineaceae bacterium]
MTEIENSISRMHLASYYENLAASPQKQDQPYPQYLDQVSDESSLISLPDIADFQPQISDLIEVIEKRRSVRRYDETAITTTRELSYLLKYTQGVRQVDEKRDLTIRFVPSAGSRHAFETYLLIQRVEGIVPGLYRYVAQRHALQTVDLSAEVILKLHESVLRQKQVITSAITFFWVADVYRTSWRYSTRAYRYIHLDAGHVCQNLYLCAESIDHAVCAIAAFDDHQANHVLGLDEVERILVYVASVGKKIHQD